MSEANNIPAYPWAAPTPEQRAAFDALPADEHLRLLRAAIDEGFKGEPVTDSMDDILRQARAQVKAKGAATP